MKIFIICSKAFFKDIAPIKEKLEKMGHSIEVPHTYGKPETEAEMWAQGETEHNKFKSAMFKKSEQIIQQMDAVLALNFDKNGNKNYIGASTFLELYEAFRNNKKIYLYNAIPEGMLFDEISGFSPTVIDGDLELIK